jgi:manganese transport protein
MDPGNWATDLAGGARFGYSLLAMIMISNLMAILLQHLCIKLGVATGRDLAQACRDHYSLPTVWSLWILCEIAIAACDLAEVVGSAIGLQLLFGHSARVGLSHYGVGCLAGAVSANQGLSLYRGDRDHSHRHDR